MRVKAIAAIVLGLVFPTCLPGCAGNPSPIPVAGMTLGSSQTPSGQLPGRENETTAEILTRVGAYVRQFEKDFSYVLSDEVYDQHAVGRAYVAHSTETRPLPATSRTLRSEMLFLWIKTEEDWMGVRNVLAVDDRPVPDSEQRLERALKDTSVEGEARLRRLRDESARFNLGEIYRNFNVPTLVLQFLDPDYQPRFRFTVVRQETVAQVPAWKIAFEEHERPTIITAGSADLFAKGFFWVSRIDATVLKTSLALQIETTQWNPGTVAGALRPSAGGPTSLVNVTASIEVDYGRDPKLEMWVPVRMQERYEQNPPGGINLRGRGLFKLPPLRSQRAAPGPPPVAA